MPGRLLAMERDAVKQPDGVKKHDRDTDMDMHSDMATRDKDLDRLSNGATKDKDSLPPELEHWAHTYVPMGKLLERIAQQCYHDLGETMDHMAEIPVTQPSPQLNGASSSAPDPSPQSVDKKLRLMTFAQTQKDRFIKALVLSDWARNMDEMDKMIELRMWLSQQDNATREVTDAIVRLKHNMIPAKMPNPNIQGALELLSTGKAPWVPDLGYIPPKPLSAQKLLKTLRDMNFALSVRLNLHQELPPHFCNYSVANGRATFVVPNEFELDLAIIDEDPQSPFYFIDVRFLFANAPPLADGFVRSSLEGKVNQVLEIDGLSACYDFLHGFVLTHKITLLRRQAFELSRGRWTECLKVEPIHRYLVVQYWTGQPGGKNWFEVAVAKGLSSAKRSGQNTNPVRLNIRWFKQGKETSEVHFDVEPSDPSMERILDQVTAAHVVSRLATMRDQLRNLSPPDSALSMDLHTSSTDPNACSLVLKLGPAGADITLRIVPVTGDICISPVTPTSIDVEQRLNADPSINAAQIITYLNCKLLQDQISRQAIRTGWLLMPTDKQQPLNKVFGDSVVRRTTFTRRGWGESWGIAVSVSLSGAKWWTVRLMATPTSRSIQGAEALPFSSTATTYDRQMLLDIESKAVALVSLSNIANQLREAKIHHQILHAPPISTDKNKQNPESTAIMGIKFEDLMQPADLELRKDWKPWCKSTTLLTHHGVDESSREDVKVIHVLKTFMRPDTASDLANLVSEGGSSEGISFGDRGVCALQLRTRFGADLVSMARNRLRRVERLSTCLRILKKYSFTLEHAGVSRLAFKYQSDPPLSAELLFSDNASLPAQLSLPTISTILNPHRRILPLLQKLLSISTGLGTTTEARCFSKFAYLLTVTLPTLRGLATIEARNPSGLGVKISTRGIAHFRIIYEAPLPSLVLEIRNFRKEGQDFWRVQPSQDRPFEDEGLLKALRDVWMEEKEGVVGFSSGAVAELKGVEDLLERIDAVVRERPVDRKANNAALPPEVVVLD